MTAKKNSLDKRFRAPLDLEEPLVFDTFNSPNKDIKGLEKANEVETTGESVEGNGNQLKQQVESKKTQQTKKNVGKQETSEGGVERKFSKFEDYKVDPGKNEGTITKTFTLDTLSNAKLTKISLALDVPLRVLFSNLIDEFYSKYEKDVKKQLLRNLDM